MNEVFNTPLVIPLYILLLEKYSTKLLNCLELKLVQEGIQFLISIIDL